nr:hypothetical protein [Halorubrum halophilum]
MSRDRVTIDTCAVCQVDVALAEFPEREPIDASLDISAIERSVPLTNRVMLNQDRRDEPIAYHSRCQRRTLGVEAFTEAVLEDCGFDVVTSDGECCRMAENVGYKSKYYDSRWISVSDSTTSLRTRTSERSSQAGCPAPSR